MNTHRNVLKQSPQRPAPPTSLSPILNRVGVSCATASLSSTTAEHSVLTAQKSGVYARPIPPLENDVRLDGAGFGKPCRNHFFAGQIRDAEGNPIVVLGRLNGDAADRIAHFDGSVSAHLDVIGKSPRSRLEAIARASSGRTWRLTSTPRSLCQVWAAVRFGGTPGESGGCQQRDDHERVHGPF